MGGRGDDTGERVRDHGVAGYPGGRLCPARLCCLLRLYPCGTHGLQRLQGHTLARDHGLVYHRRTFCGGGDAPPGVSHPRRRPAPRRDHGGRGLFRPPHPGIFPARHHRRRGGRKGDRGRIRVRPGSSPGLGRRAYHRQWTGRRGQLAALIRDVGGCVNTSTAVAVAIFLITYVGIGMEKINRTVVAGAGAVALMMFGILSLKEAVTTYVHWETVGLLFGMFTLIVVLSEAGFFAYMALMVAKRLHYDPYRIFLGVPVLTAFMSAGVSSRGSTPFFSRPTYELARL